MSQTASVMQGQNPLDALEPNILPPSIGTWPPAIGWWLVAFLVLASVTTLSIWLWRWYRRNAYRRAGRKRLQLIREQFQKHNDRHRYLQEINYLLKAVALEAFPRKDIASLSGREWQLFLNKTQDKSGTTKTFTKGAGRVLGTDKYEKETGMDPEPLFRVVELWIRKHHV